MAMAKTSDRIDDDVGVVKVRRWNSLLQLTTLLSQLEELAASPIESPSFLVSALDSGFLKKRKRSPRNVKSRFKKPQSPKRNLCTNQLSEKPRIDDQEKKRPRLVIHFKKRAPTRSPNLLAALDRGFLKKRKRSPRNHNNFLATDHQEPIFKKPPISDGEIPETSSGGEQSPKSTLCRNPNFENKKRKRGLELEEETSPNCWGKSKRRQLMVDRHILDNIPNLPEAIRARIMEGAFVGSAQCRLLQVGERFMFPGCGITTH